MTILLKYWKLILAVVLFFALWVAIGYIVQLRKDNQRLTQNQEQLTKENERELTLKKSEYEHLNTAWRDKLDSVLKDNKIKLRNVQSATVIQTVYRDTGTTKVIYKDVIKLPSGSYKIPLEIDQQCFKMKAMILSSDPASQLDIIEKTYSNSIQLLIVKKKFLGFLWNQPKRTQFKAFTDCGESDITKIDFVKK